MTSGAHRFVLVHTRDAALWHNRLTRRGLEFRAWPCAGGALFWHCTHPDAYVDADGACLLLGQARGGAGPTSGAPLSSRDLAADRDSAGQLRGAARLPGNYAEVLAGHEGATVRLNVTSTQWVCYARRDDGLVIGDDLPELCALLAPVEIDPDALVHHLAFRRQLAGRTYVRGIQRALPGQVINIGAEGYKRWLGARLADLMPAEPFDRVTDDNIARFEATAERVVGSAMRQPSALLLSGGVDSTLIGSLMRSQLPYGAALQSFSYSVPVPEFEREVDYARMAAARLTANHHFAPVSLSDYPDWLERSVAACAAPISEEQMPCFLELIDQLAGQPARRLFSGEGSDDILGIPGAKRWLQLDRYRRWPGAARLFGAAGRLLSKLVPDKAHGMRELAQLLPTLDDPLSPHHPANDYGYSDWALLDQLFGAQRVRGAIAERVAVLEAHFPAQTLPLVEYVHQLDMLNEMMPSESLLTALFARRGLNLVSPFMDSEVVAAAYAYDGRIRFHYNDRTKWLPRLLIEKREQAEAAWLPKQHGGFPQHIAWELKQGALHERLRAMPRPAWLDAASFERKLEQPDWLTWNILTWRMFEEWVAGVNADARR